MKQTKDGFISVFDGGLLVVWDRLGVDGVAIVVVKEEDVVVAADGWDNKATCLVGAYLSSDCLAVGVDVVCAMVWLFLEISWR